MFGDLSCPRLENQGREEQTLWGQVEAAVAEWRAGLLAFPFQQVGAGAKDKETEVEEWDERARRSHVSAPASQGALAGYALTGTQPRGRPRAAIEN